MIILHHPEKGTRDKAQGSSDAGDVFFGGVLI
jgi:hypothetical protein